jgi:outer membrane immunogenic protein
MNEMTNQLRTALLAGIAASALTAGAASAGDPKFNWNGFYIGANGGGGQFTGYSSNYYGGIESTEWGGTAGGTVGWNCQDGSLVLGLEGDMNWSGLEADSGDTYGGSYRTLAEWDWFATVRARAGLAFERTQVFITGGIVIADTDYRYCYNSDCSADTNDASLDETDVGIALGVGTEFNVDDNVTAKFEYLYLGLETENTLRVNGDPMNFRSYAYIGRVGVNWMFDM